MYWEAKRMNAQTLRKLEDMSRIIALWTSAAATMMFAWVFFNTNINFGYELKRFFAGKEESVDLPAKRKAHGADDDCHDRGGSHLRLV